MSIKELIELLNTCTEKGKGYDDLTVQINDNGHFIDITEVEIGYDWKNNKAIVLLNQKSA